MSKKILFLAALVAIAGASAMAFTHIVVNKGNADQATISLSDLSKIRFMDGGLVFSHQTDYFVPYSQLSTIHFANNDQTGTNDLAPESFKAVIDGSRTSITFYGIADGATATIYSLSGNVVLSAPVVDGQSVDISRLVKGMYIAKVGENTHKFVK